MKNIKPKRKGRPPLHGSYSLMVRAGELPENRKHIRAFLSAARAGLVRDLGPTEQDLTTAQLILVDRVICKLGILRCIEEHIRETGVMKGQNLAPVLQDSYGHYSNAVRLDLAALGIKARAGEGVLVLADYIKVHDVLKSKAKDAEKSQTKPRKYRPETVRGQAEAGGSGGDDMAEVKQIDPGASGGDISRQGEGGIDGEAESGQGEGE